jgi:hypothetical protein
VDDSNEILSPRMPGESKNEYKRRRLLAVLDYVRKFYLKYGHTQIPEGRATIGGEDVRHLWTAIRSNREAALPQYAKAAVTELSALGVDVPPEIVQRRKKPRVNLASLEQQRLLPYLQAIETFAERHGHTNIPDHVTSRVGKLRYGVTANAWRRARAGGVLSPWLVKRLEGIPGWTWRIVEKPGPPEKVVLPEDTTQMRRPGLRQFLIED